MQTSRFALPLNLLVGILAISTASIFIRFAQAEGVPSIVIAAFRLFIATLLLAPVALLKYWHDLKRLTRTDLILGSASGIFLALHFASWITSLEFTSVASSALFVATSPLWTALLSPILLREKLGRRAAIGLIVAFLGGAVIGLSEACIVTDGIQCPQFDSILQGRAMWGNFLALAGAWAVTGYLIIGRKLREKLDLIPYVFMVYGMAAIVLIIIMFSTGHSPNGYSTNSYVWMISLAIVPQLLGHSTLNWALRHLSATLVAVTTLSEPIGSSILAMILLSETPQGLILIGGIFILFGIYLTSRDRS